MNQHKKIIIILVLVFLLISIATVSAKNSTQTANNNTQINSITGHTSSNTMTNSEKINVEKNTPKKPIKKDNTTTKTSQQKINVQNFTTLRNTLKNSNYNTLTPNINNNINLQDNIMVNPNITSLTINGNNKTINGQNKYQFLNLKSDSMSSPSITMNNIQVTNCYGNDSGGAIHNGGENAELVPDQVNITKSIFIHNNAESEGSCICIFNSSNIHNNTFKHNYAKTTGKTIKTHAYSILKNNINENTSQDSSTIYANGISNITNNYFEDKIEAKITLLPIKGVIGEDITLTAYLKDNKNNNINGGNLAFKLNGKTLRNDSRFDSKAGAMKLPVKNGIVKISLKADIYLRNAKNLTAAYSGTSTIEETQSDMVEAQIQKRRAKIDIAVNPNRSKQYDKIQFTATVTDITRNTKNMTLINQDTKVMFKVNGVTLKDNNKKIVYVPVKNNTAVYNYTIPAGTGGITNNKSLRDYKVDAIFVGNNYYPGARNTSKFNVERSNTTVTIEEINISDNNMLNLKATLTDYKGNNLIGTNKVAIKINGNSYTDSKGKAVYWSVKDGKVNLINVQIDPKTTIKRVMLVTGERQAYMDGRAEKNLEEEDNMTRTSLRLTVNDNVIEAKLLDNPTSKDFVSLLPLSLDFYDLMGREKYAHLPRALNEGGPSVETYTVGMLAYYAPMSDIAIYYLQDNDTIPGGIIPIATITEEDIDLFKTDVGKVYIE